MNGVVRSLFVGGATLSLCAALAVELDGAALTLRFDAAGELLPLYIVKGAVTAAGNGKAFLPCVDLKLPPLCDVLTALALAFMVGAGIVFTRAAAVKRVVDEFAEIVKLTILKVIIPGLPIYILTMICEMTASGKIGAMAATMVKVIGTGWALTLVFLVLLYAIARRNPLRCLWNMMPAYLTGLSIASSSAVIPVTLACCEKNGISKDVRNFVVPLCANVHRVGSAIKMIASTLAVMMASYMALDGYGPAANVTGDGAIALAVDRFFVQSCRAIKFLSGGPIFVDGTRQQSIAIDHHLTYNTHMRINAQKLLPAVAALALQSFAYAPPVARAGGVSLTIVSLDQGPCPAKVDFDRRKINVKVFDVTNVPPLVVAVSNGSPQALTGTLAVGMNEDWQVLMPASSIQLALAPGEARDFTCRALPRPTVLPMLYPVHAVLTLPTTNLHAIAVFRAVTTNRAFHLETTVPRPLRRGRWRLDKDFPYSVGMCVKGREWTLAAPDQSDPKSRGVFRPTGRGGAWGAPSPKPGFMVHPPYATGGGEVRADFPLELPAGEKARLRFDVALSNVGKPRNPGDGVTVRVLVKDTAATEFVECHRAHIPASGLWHAGTVDLSAYAGHAITLRLAGDPGPKNNTAFDSHAWGDLLLEIGDLSPAPTEAVWRAREAAATAKARQALTQGTDSAAGMYRLETRAAAYGAAVVPGPAGLLDAVLAFTDGTSTITLRGFEAEVDGHPLCGPSRPSSLLSSVSAEKGTLKISWRVRDVARATARFTHLAVGAASLPAQRVYLGTGSVWEDLASFTFRNSGFILSTRHVGIDYPNGLSLVQATDVPPDAFEVCASNRLARLTAHNDVVFLFTPSSLGAFDAAMRFADASGYRASPGLSAMAHRICIDDWSSNYRREAAALRRAKQYGLHDVLYLQHNWQRWGYDVRLPEVYPPRGNLDDFRAMREAARDAGYLFAIHDNYVDFYPDAEGYSSRLFAFNPDGTPLEAWYNPSSRSISYRWLPAAIHPCLRANLARERDGFQPEALFIDVFTASSARDTYDCRGHFTPIAENIAEWRQAWTEARAVYGVSNAVMVSEAAADSQIGFVDAGEADHYSPQYLTPTARYADAERIPWHDAVTHGKMLLFGGGLGGRYANDNPKDRNAGDRELHGYGSDDYLCTTVIGGRVPMGPSFGRITARTYWMLHDVCGVFGQSAFTGFAFADGNLHRQHTTFAHGGKVWINRETNAVWRLQNGLILPTYGFYAKAPGGFAAAVELRDGMRVGWASGPGYRFVDARPVGRGQKGDARRLRELELNASGRKIDFDGIVTDGAFRLTKVDGNTLRLVPLPDSRAFSVRLDLVALGAAGRTVSSIEPVAAAAKEAQVAFRQQENVLEFTCPGTAFAYEVRIRF